ncbi:MAG: threonyl-tRNA synthetase [Candidatus Xenolissoclinum pacificiensis L6]|uniref:Threonine--tRNA ligase n=1 Tax=Candidatus Xenolissoclinum pacificiensis L6 TaxID=1401685 RepID=W2V148_9RICK|nr:MAG: threonyl-tRNA synthetase [Candidatus Xenolissoclinum pacificiensis L6]
MMNIKITFPDSTIKVFPGGITGREIAEGISPSFARKVVFMSVNDTSVDLGYSIDCDSAVMFYTLDHECSLEVIRHDATHIMAQAIDILYSDASFAIGPTINNGFYYDVDLPHQISIDDFPEIEKKMHEIIESEMPVMREVWSKEKALKYFSAKNQMYKVEMINDFPDDTEITIYKQGDFIDLCRGPHSPHTGFVKAVKLTKISGAYWRSDQKNRQLQRIYGTAWESKKSLQRHLDNIIEAESRGHQKLGASLGLFHIQNECLGSVFWHKNGTVLFNTLKNYISGKLLDNGYYEIKTPIMADKALWEKSGHWQKFKQNMYCIEGQDKNTIYAMKPMNCPLHIQVFNKQRYSHKDLPVRMSEFGCCHRNESSGSLHGLLRVRSLTQDDAHIFCTEDQIENETINFCKLLHEVYKELGFQSIKIKLADRPTERLGDEVLWDKAESSLHSALKSQGLAYSINPGEGAFYGPKIEFVLTDALDRDWQCGTLQIDFILPKRLDATYINATGRKQHPVMIHRAILGTFERFIGILIEHYAGFFPLWLAPEQLHIVVLNDKCYEYVDTLVLELKKVGIRFGIDHSDKNMEIKIKNSIMKRIPILWIIGDREVETSTVSVRKFGNKKSDCISATVAIYNIKDAIQNKN